MDESGLAGLTHYSTRAVTTDLSSDCFITSQGEGKSHCTISGDAGDHGDVEE